MTSTIPAALKSADIARFAQRAGQVENAKPAIAYWCKSSSLVLRLPIKLLQAITGL